MVVWGSAEARWQRLEAWLAQLGAVMVGVGLLLVAAPSARAGVGAWLAASAGPAGTERAWVARAVDGDTLDLVDGRTVRVLGIDTPETHNPALAGPQPLGPEATARLAALVAGRAVALEPDTTDRDHYGRLLRHVWRGRTLVAEVLAREGLARAYVIPPDSRHAARLRAAEAAARAARRGIWGLPRPTPLPIFGGSP
jgi:endonuclease YncB( thermonuclease family)